MSSAKTGLQQALQGYPLHPQTNCRIVAVGTVETAIEDIERMEAALRQIIELGTQPGGPTGSDGERMAWIAKDALGVKDES